MNLRKITKEDSKTIELTDKYRNTACFLYTKYSKYTIYGNSIFDIKAKINEILKNKSGLALFFFNDKVSRRKTENKMKFYGASICNNPFLVIKERYKKKKKFGLFVLSEKKQILISTLNKIPNRYIAELDMDIAELLKMEIKE